MKCFRLLPQVALVLAVAYACSDSTSPALSNAVAVGNQRASVVGKQPPPPVPTVIAVTITSTPATAIFTGVFFNNGLIHDNGVGAETSTGTAWLRFDNKQPSGLGFLDGTASANARFMAHDLNFSGNGTLTLGGVDYKIDQVISFVRFESCGFAEEGPTPCAHIEFTVTDPAGNPHGGHLLAFEKSECLDTGENGTLFYDTESCPLPDIGS
jgi:hypothetical protein